LANGPQAKAVGWLYAAEAFPTGETPAGFLKKVQRLIDGGWVPVASAGAHTCELCQADPAINASNVLVPTHDLLYVAPAMLVHYVRLHRYKPPAEFVEAVFACPAPGTTEYSELLWAFFGMWGNEPRSRNQYALIKKARGVRVLPPLPPTAGRGGRPYITGSAAGWHASESQNVEAPGIERRSTGGEVARTRESEEKVRAFTRARRIY
jgi:hypothetical protein